MHFGEAGQDSQAVIVTQIEMTEDQCQIVRAVAAAPIIDELTDAAVIPPWSSRVGAEVSSNLAFPAAPRITALTSGVQWADIIKPTLNGNEDPNPPPVACPVGYLIEPGGGVVQVSSIRVEHRLSGAASWTSVTIPVANGGGTINGYAKGQQIEFRALAVSISGVEGPYTATIPLSVGAGDAPLPEAIDSDTVIVTALPGGAIVQAGTGSDPNTSAIQLYRSMSATLDRETDAVGAPIEVTKQQSLTLSLGDSTRQTMIAGGNMDTASAWTLGGSGWTISGSKATHVAGAIGTLSQAVSVVGGRWYRVGFDVTGWSAGQVRPRFTGGATKSGPAAIANGKHLARIQADAGNTTFQIHGDANAVASVDNVVVYQETAACLEQGTHYIWLEPQNADGLPGPITGPISVTII